MEMTWQKVLSNFSIFLIKAAIWKKKEVQPSGIRKNIIFRANSSTIDTLNSREINEAKSLVDCHK